MWHGGRCAAVVWHDGGRAPAMSHGGGRAEVVVGVRRWSHCVTVAAWHGGGGRLHGLGVVVAVMSRWLQHGCGSSGGGHATAATAVTSQCDGRMA
jgi:hypothetical protein